MFESIQSLGSRCQNALILKKNNIRDFSGFFDFLNVEKVDTLIHILKNEFVEFMDIENIYTHDFKILTIDPETDIPLRESVRTSNKFYQPNNYLNPDMAICPHYDLKNDENREHFFRCIQRFKKLSQYPTLFNYTFNSWENNVSLENINEIVDIIKNKYNFQKFKICFISLSRNNKSDYYLISETENYDLWQLNILQNSYSGGIFNHEIDNINFMKIIETYPISQQRITKKIIDSN